MWKWLVFIALLYKLHALSSRALALSANNLQLRIKENCTFPWHHYSPLFTWHAIDANERALLCLRSVRACVQMQFA